MKAIFKKAEYLLLIFFLILQSQLPFLFISRFKEQGVPFSAMQTLLVLVLYFLIIFFGLWLAKKEDLLTLDFRFFNWSSLGWLGLSYAMMMGVAIVAAIIMKLEGQPMGTTANQAALEELFKNMPVILLAVGAVFSAPILEEVIFRGLIPQKLFPNHYIWGLALGSVLFGFFHSPTNIGSFVLYAGMGAVLAFVAYITKRLEMAILAHMLRNGLAILLMLLMNR